MFAPLKNDPPKFTKSNFKSLLKISQRELLLNLFNLYLDCTLNLSDKILKEPISVQLLINFDLDSKLKHVTLISNTLRDRVDNKSKEIELLSSLKSLNPRLTQLIKKINNTNLELLKNN